jgi:hypothetical protein
MSLGRIIKSGGKFRRVALNPEEEEKALETAREKNSKLFKECLRDAAKIIQDIQSDEVLRTAIFSRDIKEIAGILFQPVAFKSFSILSDELDRKVHNIKENGGQ